MHQLAQPDQGRKAEIISNSRFLFASTTPFFSMGSWVQRDVSECCRPGARAQIGTHMGPCPWAHMFLCCDRNTVAKNDGIFRKDINFTREI